MKEELILELLSATSIDGLEKVIAADSFLSNSKNWQKTVTPILGPNAIEALVVGIHDALKSVVRQKCRLLGENEAIINEEPSIIRDKLYPEASSWTTYTNIVTSARAVMLAADGKKFSTNLILSDEGILNNRPTQIPGTLAFCGPRSWLCYAFRELSGNWRIILYRYEEEGAGAYYCEVVTPSNCELPFHPEASRVQKFFKYDLPIGGRSVITKDVLDLIQQTIHDATIPFVLSDQPKRYNFDRFLTKSSLGLEFKLKRSQLKNIAFTYSEVRNGKIINLYLFKLRTAHDHEQTVRNYLFKLYFKTDRHVVFLKQGLVNGQLGADFIEFSVGFKYLKDHLLVSVSNVTEPEIEDLKDSLAVYLAEIEELKKWNRIYNEELTCN